MKGKIRTLLVVGMVGIQALSCSGNGDNNGNNNRNLMWVLVHPSNAPDGPGVFVYDRDVGKTVKHFALPDPDMSPHSLAYDGTSLWLSGYSSNGDFIYELSPDDGSIRSTIPNIGSEGLAIDGDTLWYGENYSDLIKQIKHDGTVLREIPSSLIVNDLTIDESSLYFIINSDTDPIIKVDLETGKEMTLIEPAVMSGAPYTLAYDGQYLEVVDTITFGGDNKLRRIDPQTGAWVDLTPLNVRGWITAIAFPWHRTGQVGQVGVGPK